MPHTPQTQTPTPTSSETPRIVITIMPPAKTRIPERYAKWVERICREIEDDTEEYKEGKAGCVTPNIVALIKKIEEGVCADFEKIAVTPIERIVAGYIIGRAIVEGAMKCKEVTVYDEDIFSGIMVAVADTGKMIPVYVRYGDGSVREWEPGDYVPGFFGDLLAVKMMRSKAYKFYMKEDEQ